MGEQVNVVAARKAVCRECPQNPCTWLGYVGDCPHQKPATSKMAAAIRKALDELGVLQPGYPQPVVNAVEILEQALKGVDLCRG